MGIFNHFELLDFEADTLIWEGQCNLIANPKGVISVSGPSPGMVIVCTIAIADISAAGSCADVSIVGLMYVDTEPATVSASGATDAIVGYVTMTPGPAQATDGGSASILVIAIIAPDAGMIAASGNSAFLGALSILSGSKKIYECELISDGLEWITIPISAFTSRQRAGDPSYSEVIIPGLQYLSEVLDRQTGTFRVSVLMVKNGVTLQREILFETEISAISMSGNTRDQQIMLSGYRTSSANNVPAVVPVSGVNYRSLDSGVATLRKPEPDLYLRPGDTVQYDGDVYIVELITFSYSAIYGSAMEIRGS